MAAPKVPACVPCVVRNVWDQDRSTAESYPQLKENLTADVVVVGAGMFGLNIAYNLSKAGKKVVVLEGRSKGSGQTGRTSAHLMMWNDDYYYEIEEQFGEAVATKVAQSHRAAIDFVEKVAKEEGIECKFARTDGYLFPLTEDKEHVETLDKEMAAARRAGLVDVRKVDLGGGPEVGKIREALVFPGCADFQPLLYLNGLAQAITAKHGGRIFEHSRVMQTQGKKVSTTDGFTVEAPNVVLATNSPIHHNLLVHSRQKPWKSYVVGLRIPKDKVKAVQYWDTASPYHYVRTEDHPEHGLILIVGGEDHPTGMKPNEYEDKYAKLEAWAKSRWIFAGERVFEWNGQVFEPIDHLHLFGKDPLNDMQLGATYYIATGDSGQGMTGGALAGMVIADEILGVENPFAKIYSPSRKPPASLETLQEVGSVAKTVTEGYAELANPLYQRDIEDIVPGEGAVVQRGLQKVAVYKDDAGKVHAYSALCPHMECVLQFNPLEKTFDCPCHGSYFSKEGKWCAGPAKTDLTPVELTLLGTKRKAK